MHRQLGPARRAGGSGGREQRARGCGRAVRQPQLRGPHPSTGPSVVPGVAAHDGDPSDLPARIDLPNGWQPEGIESWGKWLYAGSLKDGAIWRANAKNGEGRIFVPGETGKVAVGLHLDRWGRLWAAGGPTGEVRVFNARNGKLLQTYTFGPGPMFLNDLDIARNRVVVTDSMNARVGVIPLRKDGRYELIAEYNNTGGEAIDAMAILYLYALDRVSDQSFPPAAAVGAENRQ